MKVRCALLIVTALLLAAGAASATTAPAAALAAPATAPRALATGFGESLACSARISALGTADFTPAPSPATGATCGSCSRSPCQGATYGVLCGYSNGSYGYCLSPLGDNCSDGVTFKCQCWYGPLP